jgi:hypothetical protein
LPQGINLRSGKHLRLISGEYPAPEFASANFGNWLGLSYQLTSEQVDKGDRTNLKLSHADFLLLDLKLRLIIQTVYFVTGNWS